MQLRMSGKMRALGKLMRCQFSHGRKARQLPITLIEVDNAFCNFAGCGVKLRIIGAVLQRWPIVLILGQSIIATSLQYARRRTNPMLLPETLFSFDSNFKNENSNSESNYAQ